MVFSLYKIVNLSSGKFYVGVTCRDISTRFNEHLSTAKCCLGIQSHFYRALRKNGRKGFSIELIFEVDDRVQAMEAEIRLIAELKPDYNSTLGGDGTAGHTLSAEAKEKIANANRGNKYCLGKKHTQETKNRLREIGLSLRDEWAKRAHRGPEALRKAVVCLNDGSVYASASAAAKTHGLSKSLVIEVCLRDPRRLMAGKKVFRYVGDHFGGKDEAAAIAEKYSASKSAGGKSQRKAVKCITDGESYESATVAGKRYALSRAFVQELCLGKKKSKRGLEFCYVD
jgi:group I intron endonuclease